MNGAEPLVQASHLQKRYGDFLAVDDVSFAIQRGEIFGLLGPNGAGKTTTLSMLAGLLPPTEGEILVGGANVRQKTMQTKRILGMVPQELAIYPRLTGRENLEFFGQLYGLNGAPLLERIGAMLELVGLTERADSRADTYSGGMKRRLNLAAGLMHSPQALLLDEPTVGVDPQSRNHIFEGIRDLNRKGLTVLYTSHYMEEVEALCDRVGIMDGGKLIACDTVPNLISQMGQTYIEIAVTPTEPLPALLARLESLDRVQGVDTVVPDGESEEADSVTLRVLTENPNLALPGLVSSLNAASVPLLNLAIHKPNLEDVFLTLTGKKLRD